MKKYPCPLSPKKDCKYGGNKSYNYGFVSGTQPWCYKIQAPIYPVIGGKLICPLKQEVDNEKS